MGHAPVANQNVNLDIPGEVLRFDADGGAARRPRPVHG